MLAMIKWLFILAFILMTAGFCVVNRHFITLEFYPLPWQVELPVYLLLLFSFMAGFFICWLSSRLQNTKLRLRARKAEHKNDALKEEVTRLRHQPLPKS